MDPRFLQAHKEACWALALSLFYLMGWLLTAYLPSSTPGLTGLPVWFELSCIALPLVSIIFCWLMVRFLFRIVPFEDNPSDAE